MLTSMPQVQQNTPDELQGSRVALRGPMPEPILPPHVTTCLGERLRAYYSQVMNDPVPDSFTRILEVIDRKGRASRGL